MALEIITPKHKTGENPVYCVCEILVDTEDEINALDRIVTDGRTAVIPAPGSVAYTASMSAAYQLSPSNVWTRMEA